MTEHFCWKKAENDTVKQNKGETMRSPLTTLCYVEQDGKYLMLHRIKKKKDVNKDKWIGIGGHFEENESPEQCLLREAYEETGLRLTSWKFRGIVTFAAEGWPTEYMCLYTADGFERGTGKPSSCEAACIPEGAGSCLTPTEAEHGADSKSPSSPDDTACGEEFVCNEGQLEWVPKEELTKLNLWEGDKIFLKLLAEDAPFFSLKLTYRGDTLTGAWLDGKEMELFDVCDESGEVTGRITERSVAHSAGVMHRTSHVWIVREAEDGTYELLMQKRSSTKDSYPSCYDVSSAGHVTAGDSYLTAARRELEEELGISAAEEDLECIGRFDSGDILNEFGGRRFHNREITSVYVYRQEIETEHLQLQKEEVESVKWLSLETVHQAVADGNPAFCVLRKGLELLEEYLYGEAAKGMQKK